MKFLKEKWKRIDKEKLYSKGKRKLVYSKDEGIKILLYKQPYFVL